ncbi:universal stress protein [Massilia sp. B-10]|nr:universal stress protein [Massilia sp. B-10]
MYSKILITTDSSAVSRQTACLKRAVPCARWGRAYWRCTWRRPTSTRCMPKSCRRPIPARKTTPRKWNSTGADHTKDIVQAARDAGLACEALTAFADSAALKIVEVAEQQHCDLIFMGSHGRSGWGQLLLGSVTNKVLSHTTKPVLVHRLIKAPAT